MNYYISDLHLFHEASIGFDGRPFRNLEEMHAEIVRKWNSKVTNGDTVYILGDMSMRGKNEDLIALVAILKGKKVLIRAIMMMCPILDTGSCSRKSAIIGRSGIL